LDNPLQTEWTNAFGLAPFDQIKDRHFAPAIEQALASTRAKIDRIASAKDTPSFVNTIDALEQADHDLGRILAVFYNLASADSTAERRDLQRDLAPKLAALRSEIAMNAGLFTRIEELWNKKQDLDLTNEQQRVLMLTRRDMIRSGAALGEADQQELAKIMDELAQLQTSFTQNLLADEFAWNMDIPADVAQKLPTDLTAGLAAAAKEHGKSGYVLTSSRSLMTPFLQYCPDRALRAAAFAGWSERGARGDKNDNRAIAARILKLRHDRARLLGHDDFAGFKLETEMAGTPQSVKTLLDTVWARARNAAENDAAALQKMLQRDHPGAVLAPHDWRYYSEIRRKNEHALDEAELRAYFSLEHMIDAAFSCANRLFGLDVEPLDVPLYHPDARAWNVSRQGHHVAVFIADYFARSSKRSGAWCSAMRSQQKLAGDIRPIVVNICNFSKPPEGQPALLSYDDARTLFHEFGHALHQMLSDVTYPSVSGTSVARDFVELPSQLFEHWLEVPEVLSEFARHHETGAPIPDDLRDRLLAARSYDTGFATVEYVSSALVDLGFHTGAPPADPMQAQAEILDSLNMPAAITMRHATPHFAHVFSGDGYSAGYYSYMWSEVMDADAFDAFEEKGNPFDPDVAASLEANILSCGGAQPPEELYTAFRGRMPDIAPLLKGRGLA
jgi:peptidyl-dipeptidase Dcp